jgi:nanoRNase/pAp phosphatase (c-di-AMP/oligoRNAs hydrolase)
MNVNLFARHFGGGGHPAASGFRMSGPLSTAPQRLREKMQEHLASLAAEPESVSSSGPAANH